VSRPVRGERQVNLELRLLTAMREMRALDEICDGFVCCQPECRAMCGAEVVGDFCGNPLCFYAEEANDGITWLCPACVAAGWQIVCLDGCCSGSAAHGA